MTIFDRVAARIARLFGYRKPEPPTLKCGCTDDAHRYVCGCGRTACEQHRNDPHACIPEGVSP
jgi:hypothetical protein